MIPAIRTDTVHTARPAPAPQIGVEEEFLLVDAVTRVPAPRIARILPRAQRLAGEYTESELHRAQIETASEPCSSLEELSEQLKGNRLALAQAARKEGALVLALGTFPGRMGEPGRLVTDKPRYRAILDGNPLIAREQLICGCHVHVTVEDDHERVRVLNQVRRYLHCLLALSANSPFWEGEDSGFASFRTEVWARWPTAGPSGDFDHPYQYWEVIEKLVQAGVVLDEGMVYWDARLSRHYPTIEIRIADVGLTVDDSVTIAGLARALVMDCLRTPGAPLHLRPELLRAASWRAARTGVRGELMDPMEGVATEASEFLSGLLARITPVLSDSGDGDRVEQGIQRILSSGTGADRQRANAREGQGVDAVIELGCVDRQP